MEKIWVDLCHGETNKVAESYCQSFLRAYVEFSRVWRPSLGPNEWEVVKTVNHAVTIEDVWSALVRNADTKVLQVKRTEKFEETGQWPTELELRYSSRDKNKRGNPAYRIAQVTLLPPPNDCMWALNLLLSVDTDAGQRNGLVT